MSSERNGWKGAFCGALAGAAGIAAMDYFTVAISKVKELAGEEPGKKPLHSKDEKTISAIGKQYREEENSTEALARIAYYATKGRDPSEETKSVLGELMHWGYGMALGAAYGAVRPDAEGADVPAAMMYGAGLWAVGDEVAVPLLGLGPSPMEKHVVDHVAWLGAHLAYAITTVSATRGLMKIL